MKNTSRYLMMCVAALAVVALSAVTTIPVLADDGDAPPPPAPTETETPPEAAGDSEPAQEVSTEDATVPLPELLEQIPETTEVVVMSETGEALPLASEAAAQVAVTGDPMWCPTGVTPGGAGCSPAFQYFNKDNDTPLGFNGLIGWLNSPANAATVSKAGVIWVASAYNGAGDVSNGSHNDIEISPAFVEGTMENFALTIQGGWSGLNNTTLDPNNPSVFKLPLTISGWIGAITIKNVVFEGIASSPNYTLDVQTTGNITLDGVAVVNNTGSGARLDNDADGAASLGTVTVNNSTFNANTGGDGLQILTDGTVTTNNIVANGNGGDGVEINNAGATADKTVTMKGYKQFNGNGQNGLLIQARGAVTISNLNADRNTLNGVTIDNTVSALAGVTLTGVSYFNENGGHGLEIDSRGAILLNNLNALNNGDNGADIDNSAGVAKTVTINGINNFSWNVNSGLNVLSNGTIIVNNVNAAYNAYGNGAFLNNTSSVTGAANVSVLGTNYFLNNNESDTDDSVDAGLKVLSHGAITANNVTASFNGGDGAYLDNCDKDAMRSTNCDLALPRNVTLTGVNVFNGNEGFNGKGFGIEVFSFGTITLTNITAGLNVENGALLRNDTSYWDSTLSVYKYSAGGVTINGYGIFNDNGADGMYVGSQGNVLTTNLTANSNNYGVYISAQKPSGVTGSASVKVNGVNTFNMNDASGLSIEADGAVSVNSVTANDNGLSGSGYGVWINNSISPYTTATVTLTGYVRVSNNPDEGLLINSRGAVTVNNITAEYNGFRAGKFDGVSVTNTTGNLATPQNVTILGTNSFVGNGKNGLFVDTYGVITLYNASASYNGTLGVGSGIYLDNYDAGYTLTVYKGVSIFGYARAISNANGGLYINTRGAVTLANLYANFNGASDGVYIKNNYTNTLGAAVSQNVTITGTNTFANNTGNGLRVLTYGAISVSNITATSNGANGAYFDNCRAVSGDCATTSVLKNLTLTGTNSFYSNTNNGLVFSVSGAATLSNVSANRNGTTGDFKGALGTSTGAMTLTCFHAYGNGNSNDDGYNLTTSGAIVLFNGAYYGLPTMGTVTGALAGYPQYKTNLVCP